MDSSCQCAVIIPCFNEGAKIEALVREIHTYLRKVIVVDDGSSDATSETARRAGADIVRLPVNSGKGAALRAGCARARRLGFNWVLTLDGDGQHSPRDIPGFLECIGDYPPALVVGNRMNSSQGMPAIRRIVNRWMSRRLSNLAGVRLPDSQCGFRLIPLSFWNRVATSAKRFEIESEMLLAFIEAGCRVRFVPIETIYKNSRSRIRPFADSVRWLRWWLTWKRRVCLRVQEAAIQELRPVRAHK